MWRRFQRVVGIIFTSLALLVITSGSPSASAASEHVMIKNAAAAESLAEERGALLGFGTTLALQASGGLTLGAATTVVFSVPTDICGANGTFDDTGNVQVHEYGYEQRHNWTPRVWTDANFSASDLAAGRPASIVINANGVHQRYAGTYSLRVHVPCRYTLFGGYTMLRDFTVPVTILPR